MRPARAASSACGSKVNTALAPQPPGAARPSPEMFGSMNQPTTTADLLNSDLARHSTMMAQYQRVTSWTA